MCWIIRHDDEDDSKTYSGLLTEDMTSQSALLTAPLLRGAKKG